MSRTITVVRTWTIREGEKNGKRWRLSGVEADVSGNPISEQLKTFANLPLGEVTVDIERQDSEQYGTSYLLKPTGATGKDPRESAGGQELGQLRARIERLESEVKRLSSLVDRRDPDIPPQIAAGIPDDDIPF